MFEPSPPPPSGWATPGPARPPGPGPVLSDLVLAVRSAVDGLLGQDLGSLTGAQVLAETVAVLTEAQRLRTAGLTRLAEVDRRGLHEIDGAASTGRWVAAQGLDVEPAAVALARRMPAFPLLADQVRAGALSLRTASALQIALTRLRPYLDRLDGTIDGLPGDEVLRAVIDDGVRMLVAEARGGFATDDDPELLALVAELAEVAERPVSQLGRLEAAVLVLARHVEAAQVPGCLGLLTDALLPEAHARRAERGRDRRRLRLVRLADGSGWRLDGTLSLQAGERLFTVLQAELARDPDNPLDTAQAAELREQGHDPYDPELACAVSPRSTGERSHDALDAALGHYLAADLGGTHDKNPVQVVVTVAAEALEGAPGALPARGGSGTPLPRSLVRRWVCGSAMTRHVLDLRGRVIAASHTERTLTRHERRALHTQTGGRCQGAGCCGSGGQPATVLHPHHADPWSHCGTTSLADTVLLCEHCHHDVHDGERVLRLKDGRRLGPHGWVT